MIKDFSHQKLRGRSFKRQDLTGADFSHADVRGADFSQAILIKAKFVHTRAGQQYHWICGIIGGICVLAALSGLITGYAGGMVGYLVTIREKTKFFDQPEIFWMSGIATLIALSIFIFVVVRRGLGTALGILVVTIAGAVGVMTTVGQGNTVIPAVLFALVCAFSIAGAIVGALAVAVTRLHAGTRMALIVGMVMALAAVPGALESVGLAKVIISLKFVVLALAGIVASVMIGLSVYIGWQAVSGDQKYALIRSVGLTMASLGGTNFRGANLTDADLTQSNLKSADLRGAILTRVCWFQAQKLDHARLHGTYLENPRIRQLVLTKDGRGQNFDYLDLRGVNLQDANVQGASFIGTNLSDATLANANLTGAKLVNAQLYQANLNGACLTGAYIQDWGISTNTQLEEIACDYIYMRLPTPNDPDVCRKPDNKHENFKAGDFTDFIAPIMKTLNLYQQQNVDLRVVATTYKTIDLFHHEGLDPNAAALALQQLAEHHPDAGIEIIALEGRGHEKIRLQAKVSGDVDRSELSAQYFKNYSQLKTLAYSDLQALFASVTEKDKQIRQLGEMLETAMQQPRFYVETYENKGDFIMSQNQRTIHAERDYFEHVVESDITTGDSGPSNDVTDINQLTTQDALQSHYQLLSEKINLLRKDQILATDTEIKFKLKHQIQEAEAFLAQIEQKLDALERKVDSANKA